MDSVDKSKKVKGPGGRPPMLGERMKAMLRFRCSEEQAEQIRCYCDDNSTEISDTIRMALIDAGVLKRTG